MARSGQHPTPLTGLVHGAVVVVVGLKFGDLMGNIWAKEINQSFVGWRGVNRIPGAASLVLIRLHREMAVEIITRTQHNC